MVDDSTSIRVGMVQIGNHLYPLVRDPASEAGRDWKYVVDTGRAWSEQGDGGLSRASLPFTRVNPGTGCAQEGMLSFLFDDFGLASDAVARLADGTCGQDARGEWGLLDARYFPAPLKSASHEMESVLACVAAEWLPLVQGLGGFTLMSTPAGGAQYVLDDGGTPLWIDALRESQAVSELCR